MVVSYKAKHVLNYMTQQFHSRYLPPQNETICIHKDLYANVHSSIYNSPKLEQPGCPSNGECMNKLCHIPDYGILLRKKRNEILTRATTWVNLKNIMPSERSKRKK